MKILDALWYQSLKNVIIIQSIPKVTLQYSANFDLLDLIILDRKLKEHGL